MHHKFYSLNISEKMHISRYIGLYIHPTLEIDANRDTKLIKFLMHNADLVSIGLRKDSEYCGCQRM